MTGSDVAGSHVAGALVSLTGLNVVAPI